MSRVQCYDPNAKLCRALRSLEYTLLIKVASILFTHPHTFEVYFETFETDGVYQ